MGKGRKPCCVKSEVKRGPWSPDEDLRLVAYVQSNGHSNWRILPKKAGLKRCGKSCRLRWINYLRPDLKRGNFTKEEEDSIIKLHEAMGNKWSAIASYFPGRTDNEIKNVWNTHLKKRLSTNCTTNGPNQPSSTAFSSSSTTTTDCSSGGKRKEIEMGNVSEMDQQSKKAHQDQEIIFIDGEELEEFQNPPFSNMGMTEKPISSATFSSNNSILTHQELLGFDEATDALDFDFLGDFENELSNLLGEVNQPLHKTTTTTTTTSATTSTHENELNPNWDIWKIIEDMEASDLQQQIDAATEQTTEENEMKWLNWLGESIGS